MGGGQRERMLTVLVLTKDGKMEDNGKRSSVLSQDDELGNTSVEGLGSLVGALLQLPGICGKD